MNKEELVPMSAVEPLLEALRFYATHSQRTWEARSFRNEFGCGCCAGNVNAEGENDRDGDVQGLTAREALKKWEGK